MDVVLPGLVLDLDHELRVPDDAGHDLDPPLTRDVAVGRAARKLEGQGSGGGDIPCDPLLTALRESPGQLVAMEDVEVDFRDEALDAVANKAMERKTGARGLRSIMESVLLDTMYKLPSEQSVAKVVVDESVVKGESEPLLVYESADTKKALPDE